MVLIPIAPAIAKSRGNTMAARLRLCRAASGGVLWYSWRLAA
jgi:hypothetical protein